MSEGLPAPPQQPRLPAGVKVLLGAAVGCGALLLAAFVVGVAGLTWFLGPGEQIATRDIAGEGTVGILSVRDLAADEGAFALAARVFLEFDRAQSRAGGPTPGSMRWFEAIQEANRRQSVEGIKLYVPRELTATLELLPGDSAPRIAVAANLRMFPRLFDSVFGMLAGPGEITTATHAGREFRRLADGASLAFVGGTILWTEDEGLMRHLLERVDGRTQGAGGPPAALLHEPAAPWDLEGTLVIRPETIEWIASFGAPEAQEPQVEAWALDTLERIRIGIDVLSDDELRGVVGLDCAEPGRGGECREWLKGVLARFGEELIEAGLELSCELRTEGPEPEATCLLSGLREAVASTAQGAIEERGE